MKDIQVLTPSELASFDYPTTHVLVGSAHIIKGEIFIIGGPPGVGKSQAAFHLAVCRARRESWFGLDVHRSFKSMLVQNENGPYRLKRDFSRMTVPELDALDNYIRISLPPDDGLNINDPTWRTALLAKINEFCPDVLVFDPWNSMTSDDNIKSFGESFLNLRRLLADCSDRPAIGIIAHTRKGKHDYRPQGLDLLKEFLGSTMLVSVPRSAFIIQHASNRSNENRVVFTCCKNNNGEVGERSGWEKSDGLFVPTDIDWNLFEKGGDSRKTFEIKHLAQIFENGGKKLSRRDAVKKLESTTGFKDKACYAALDATKGRFKEHLSEVDGILEFLP